LLKSLDEGFGSLKSDPNTDPPFLELIHPPVHMKYPPETMGTWGFRHFWDHSYGIWDVSTGVSSNFNWYHGIPRHIRLRLWLWS
jgi:hypothetical protein